MTILRAVLGELLSMFIADLRLTLAVLALISLAAALVGRAGPHVAGAVLLAGSLGLLVLAVLVAARRR